MIDISNFEGQSEYIDNVVKVPQLDIYFFGNKIHTLFETDPLEISKVLTNVYNNMSDLYNTQMNNVSIVQKQILEIAKTQDQLYYKKLLQDPVLLQTITNSNIFKGHQNQNKVIIQNDKLLLPSHNETKLTQQQTTNFPVSAINILNSQSSLLNNELVPTLQQMQYMFKIFTMMQQMGILDVPIKNSDEISDDSDDTSQTTIILKNGDKLIKLNDGRYGLIKNII